MQRRQVYSPYGYWGWWEIELVLVVRTNNGRSIRLALRRSSPRVRSTRCGIPWPGQTNENRFSRSCAPLGAGVPVEDHAADGIRAQSDRRIMLPRRLLDPVSSGALRPVPA